MCVRRNISRSICGVSTNVNRRNDQIGFIG
jgi:hypothetical protein